MGFANLVLVETPDGLLLFDTGHYANRRYLLNALESAGRKPDDISAVVLSHLHYDHSINVDLFPKAHVYVSKTEWEYAGNPHPMDTAIPWGVRELLEPWKKTLVEGSLEITKGVEFFPTPGHTPGSCSLALQTEKGVVVLAGDAIKYPKEIIQKNSDTAYTKEGTAKASIEKIMDMADIIVPGHFNELCRCEEHFVWEKDSELTLISR